jgi:hypothetical protein
MPSSWLAVWVEKRGERRGGFVCNFAEWLGAKPSFHLSFRPSLTSPYLRGGRRRAGGYVHNSDGIAVSEPVEASLAAQPCTISSPVPLFSFPHLSRAVRQTAPNFLGFLTAAARDRVRGGGQPRRSDRGNLLAYLEPDASTAARVAASRSGLPVGSNVDHVCVHPPFFVSSSLSLSSLSLPYVILCISYLYQMLAQPK